MKDCKEIKGKFGKVIFGDCIGIMKQILNFPNDETIFGLFDLCVTDPPYNVDFTSNRENAKDFNDKMNSIDYRNFSYNWHRLAKLLCKSVIFTCGNFNVPMWYEIEAPFDKLIWYVKNTHTRGRAYRIMSHEEILIYGRLNNRYQFSVLDVISKWGFVRDPEYECLIHPTVKPYELWEKLIVPQQPKIVLDPFMGSGTTAEVCEANGIKYIGIEKNEQYMKDIKYRIKLGIKKYKNRIKYTDLDKL